MKKHLISGLLAVCVGFTFFPYIAFAQGESDLTAAQTDHTDASDAAAIVETVPDTADTESVVPDAAQDTNAVVPDTSTFRSNEDFKPYDPWYPQKDQYGGYTLTVPDLKGRLTLSASADNHLTATLYAPGVSAQSGWHDATKLWGKYDTGLCFAASSSNLISWYLNRYTQQHPEDQNEYDLGAEQVFNRFRNGWDPLEGGNQKEALSWYFTGGFPSGNTDPFDNHLTGNEPGGYLKDKIPHNTSNKWSEVSYDWQPPEAFSVFGSFGDERFPFIEDVGGMTGNGAFATWESFSEHIVRQLHYGACTISIVTDSTSGGAGHAITLWGVDYEVDTGLVTAIHVTDSDDRERHLFTVKTERGNKDSGVRLVNYTYHPPMGESQRFTRIRDSIVLYAPEVVKSSTEPSLPDAITSDKYPIDGDKNITEIQPGETLESIRQDLNGQDIKVFDAQGNSVPSNTPLATGYLLSTSDAADPNKLTVVISGDVNGDAFVNMRDVIIMRRSMRNTQTLNGAFKKAATFKSHSESGPMQEDIAALKQFLLKITDKL